MCVIWKMKHVKQEFKNGPWRWCRQRMVAQLQYAQAFATKSAIRTDDGKQYIASFP